MDDALALRIERRNSGEDQQVTGLTPARALLRNYLRQVASCSHDCASVTKQYKLVPV